MSYAEHLIDQLDNLPHCDECGRDLFYSYPSPINPGDVVCWNCYTKLSDALDAEARDHAETVARPKGVQ
jgi:uncharacterized Zn finger protein (UPF0148 family)